MYIEDADDKKISGTHCSLYRKYLREMPPQIRPLPLYLHMGIAFPNLSHNQKEQDSLADDPMDHLRGTIEPYLSV
jgi:hypothetical protein